MDQFLGSVKATLGSLLESHTGAEITDKLGSSILATLFRQQVRRSWDPNELLCSFVFRRDFSFNYKLSSFLADHFTSGAVLPGHPSQSAAEELLVSGGAAQESFH